MEDLSGKYFGDSAGLNGRESQQATNTVSVTPMFGAPGSASEATTGITPGTPGPDGLPPADANTLINDQAHDDAPDPYHLDAAVPGGGPWTVAPNEDTPGRGGTGPWKNPTG